MIKHVHVSECDSTQDILKEQLSAEPEVRQVLVSCEQQNMGRGRGNNVWQAMPGSLCFSLSVEAHKISSFTALEISLLVVRFFEFEGQTLKLKWPNDIWSTQYKKCGGILVQNSQNMMLAGIGLNLFSSDSKFGGIYPRQFEFDKAAWAMKISKYIYQHRYQNTDVLKKDWQDRCFHMHQKVLIRENGDNFIGRFVGLGVHGEALLASDLGVQRHYNGSLNLLMN